MKQQDNYEQRMPVVNMGYAIVGLTEVFEHLEFYETFVQNPS